MVRGASRGRGTEATVESLAACTEERPSKPLSAVTTILSCPVLSLPPPLFTLEHEIASCLALLPPLCPCAAQDGHHSSYSD